MSLVLQNEADIKENSLVIPTNQLIHE